METSPKSKLILEQFKNIFDEGKLKQAFDDFEWRNKTAQEARDERDHVANEFSLWVKKGCSTKGAEEQIQAVHKWGFGDKLNSKQRTLFNPPNLQLFVDTLKTWSSGEPEEVRQTALEKCLIIPNIGIARHSKWLCFIDQKKYAIYDSRVSLALRQIQVDGKRVFPTLPGRSLDIPRQTWLGSSKEIQAKRMSGGYMTYLELVNAVRRDFKFERAADVEIALFMLGKDKAYW